MSGDQAQVPQWVWTPPLPAGARGVEAPKQWSPRQIVVAVAAAALIAGLGTAAVAWGDRGSSTSQNGPGSFGGGFGPGGNAQNGNGQAGFGPGGAGLGSNSQNRAN